jgi:hypothetical protein
LWHLGQSVLLDVSITFWRSAVLATLAITYSSKPDSGTQLQAAPKAALSCNSSHSLSVGVWAESGVPLP